MEVSIGLWNRVCKDLHVNHSNRGSSNDSKKNASDSNHDECYFHIHPRLKL